MSVMKALFKGALRTLTLPVAIVKDVATMGGVLTDQHESYTVQKARKIKQDAVQTGREFDKL